MRVKLFLMCQPRKTMQRLSVDQVNSICHAQHISTYARFNPERGASGGLEWGIETYVHVAHVWFVHSAVVHAAMAHVHIVHRVIVVCHNCRE
jgi:hypothetical protein